MSPSENKKFFVPKNLRWAVLAGAIVAMGVTMPSCPGQQAMQDQIDQLKTSQADLSKRLQLSETQLKQLIDMANQMHNDFQGMGGMVTQTKTDVDQMKVTLQAMQAKMAPPAKGASKTSAKPRHR
jgi:septal ring factor EnvC (AmiA/AmiB activator)